MFHVFQTLAGHAQGGRVGTLGASGRGFVQALGHGFAFGEDFLSPGQQRAVAAIVFKQGEARFTTALGDGMPVGRLGGVDLGGVARAVGQQAVQQEDVEKADGSAVMPMALKGSRSISRTSMYSTPRAARAASGRSPLRMGCLGRMVP